MTHFNLNDLRADAECYAPGHHRDDHAIIIDFIVEALIGSDSYDLMQRTPGSTIKLTSYGHYIFGDTTNPIHDITK